jgi:tRNA 2-thiouridine synthesizing protein A
MPLYENKHKLEGTGKIVTGTTLDLKGLLCPLPVLRANKTLRKLAAGARVEVLATDPQAPKDFQAFCETAGHEFIESKEQDGTYTISFRKALE